MYFVFPALQGRWSPEGEIRLATHPPMAARGSAGLGRSVSDMVQQSVATPQFPHAVTGEGTTCDIVIGLGTRASRNGRAACVKLVSAS